MKMSSEQRLFLAVLCRALFDAVEKGGQKKKRKITNQKACEYNKKRKTSIKDDARIFLTSQSYDMRMSRENICDAAGIPTSWLDKLTKELVSNKWEMPKEMRSAIMKATSRD